MKYTPINTSSGYNLANINANFAVIADHLNNKVLYRNNPTGESNQLSSDLDFNSKNLLNGGVLSCNKIIVNGHDLTNLLIGGAEFADEAADSAADAAASAALSQFWAEQAAVVGVPDGAITNPKLANLAVTGAKIAAGTITSDKIDPAVFAAIPIADNSVTNSKLSTNSVTTVKIQDGAILTAKLADAQVTSAKLATNLSLIGTTAMDTAQSNFVNTNNFQVNGGEAVVGGTGSGQFAHKYNFLGQKASGVSGVFGAYQDIATQQDHGFEVWATDFKCGGGLIPNRPDLAAQNSSRMASFIGSYGTNPLTLKFPEGDYFFNNLIFWGYAAPLSFLGQSEDNTRLHFIGNQDGINFQPAQRGGGTVRMNTFTIRNMSVVKAQTGYGGVSGGAAISCTWPSGTDNRVQFVAEHVSIYSENSTTIAWAKGIYLQNVNGSRLSDICIKGDINSSSSTSVGNPYTMGEAIHYNNPTNGSGQINHFLSRLSGGVCGTFIRVDGWHEGFYVDNFEFVQPAYGVQLSGYAVTKNSNFMMTNGHIDFRISAVKATNVNMINLTNVDCYKDGGMGQGSGGVASNAIDLNSCPRFTMTGGKILQGQGTGANFSNGVLTAGTCDLGRMNGVLIELFNGGGAGIVLASGATTWVINGNSFSTNSNGLIIQSGASSIYAGDDNVFFNTTTKYSNSGTGCRIPSSPSF